MSMMVNSYLFERPFVLTNNGFETGSLSPWVNLVGSGNVTGTYFGGDQTIVPRTGSYMFNAIGGGSTVTFGQDLPIPSSQWAQVDAGDAWISNVSGYHNPGIAAGGSNDSGRMFISFLNGAGSIISTVYSAANTIASAWTLVAVAITNIPANTRTIRIGAESVAEDATHDNFWDDLTQPVIVHTFSVNPTISTNTGFFAENDVATVSYAHYGTSTSFQWTRDGVAISGATAASYTYVSADVGHVVACTVTATTGAVNVGASAPGTTIGTPTFANDTRVPAGDMNSGSDSRLTSGDMQSGSDLRLTTERIA